MIVNLNNSSNNVKTNKIPFFQIIYTSVFEKSFRFFFVNICLLDLRFPNLPKEPCQVEDIVGL